MIRAFVIVSLLFTDHAFAQVPNLCFDANGMLVMPLPEGGCPHETAPIAPLSSASNPLGPFVISAANHAVWVGDPTTGQVRICGTPPSLNVAPTCSPWSEE